MKEIPFRSIFLNNNIPAIKFETKNPTLKEKLSNEINSLINRDNFSYLTQRIKEIEFKVMVEEDPVNALLQKLNEVNNKTNH